MALDPTPDRSQSGSHRTIDVEKLERHRLDPMREFEYRPRADVLESEMDHATQTLLVETLLGSALLLWAVSYVSSMLGQGRQQRPHTPPRGE